MKAGTFRLAIAPAMQTALTVTSTHLTRSQTLFSMSGVEGAAKDLLAAPRRVIRVKRWYMLAVVSADEF
jgi:hypothetical protein